MNGKSTPFRVHLIIKILLVCLALSFLVLEPNASSNAATTYAASSGKDVYGIAAGGSLESSGTNIARMLDGYKALGAQWIRFDFDWAYIQSDGRTSYHWAQYDTAVAAARARALKVLGTIAYTPQWELPVGCKDSHACPPRSARDYAQFAAAVAARYAPKGVHDWEVWNEPNQVKLFTPASYVALLRATYPVVKKVDRNSFIITGGTAPAATNGVDISPVDFLNGIYRSGGKGYFDAVGHHPYCFAPGFQCPTAYASWSAWSQMQDTKPSLRSIMTANGDQRKTIWATEFGAPTGGGWQAVSEKQQAQMLIQSYALFKSYRWSGPLFWYTYEDPCTTARDMECYYGLVRADSSPKPAYTAYRNLARSASGK